MKRFLILPVLFSIAAPLLAVDECGPYRQLVALYQVRNALMQPYGSSYDAQKYIDRTLDDLRCCEGGGTGKATGQELT